jgi:hypothetical protein
MARQCGVPHLTEDESWEFPLASPPSACSFIPEDQPQRLAATIAEFRAETTIEEPAQ